MIQFQQVSKRYPGQQEALSNISFHLDKGEMAFLTGHSGAGKSSLLKLIALLDQPSSGTILVGGKNTRRFNKRQIPYFRRRIGIVFQEPHLLLERSVYENVALPLIIGGEVSYKKMGQRVRAALDKVKLLHKEKSYPVSLSGGERQRVGIARAVVARPQIILADEPTGNLDEQLSNEIFTLFQQFNQVGATILIATHDKQLIAQLPMQQFVLQQGKMISQ